MRSQHQAVLTIKNCGIIAHQTDTIFGLACLPSHTLLNRLSNIKKRRPDKAFILLASNYKQVAKYIVAEDKVVNTLNTPTDIPTTWLVQPNNAISHHLIGQTNKVAIRITSFEPIKNLCEQVGAIASTSANISNQSACTNAQQIRMQFGPNIDYIDTHQAQGTGKSSTIIDLASGQVIRG